MSKYLFKPFSLMVIVAFMFMTISTRPAFAADGPVAPSLLEVQASIPGDLAISMTWSDNSLDETGFEIERCEGLGCTNFVLIETRDSSIWGAWFVDVGLAENTTYSYRVRAVNSFGVSAYSNVSSATTSYARPNQVSNLVGSFANGVVNLSWTDNAINETRFEIERYEVGAGGTAFVTIATLNPDATSFVDATALTGTTYEYRVVPWRYDVYGGAPEVVTVSTGTGIAAPVLVRAQSRARTSVLLTWKGRFPIGSQVVIQRQICDVNGCFSWMTVGQVSALLGRFVDTGLSSATTYTYRIRVVTAISVSPFVTISATTR